MTEIELLVEINKKLDRLIGICAIQGKDEERQAKILKSLGFTYKEISNLTGIAEGTLKTWDHRSKKKEA
jgi:DNA-directed RNA polymerase specialized sigma24 family protein